MAEFTMMRGTSERQMPLIQMILLVVPGLDHGKRLYHFHRRSRE